MSNQHSNPIETNTLDLEFPVGSYDEFQMKAETLAVKQMMENKGRRHRSSNWY